MTQGEKEKENGISRIRVTLHMLAYSIISTNLRANVIMVLCVFFQNKKTSKNAQPNTGLQKVISASNISALQKLVKFLRAHSWKDRLFWVL